MAGERGLLSLSENLEHHRSDVLTRAAYKVLKFIVIEHKFGDMPFEISEKTLCRAKKVVAAVITGVAFKQEIISDVIKVLNSTNYGTDTEMISGMNIKLHLLRFSPAFKDINEKVKPFGEWCWMVVGTAFKTHGRIPEFVMLKSYDHDLVISQLEGEGEGEGECIPFEEGLKKYSSACKDIYVRAIPTRSELLWKELLLITLTTLIENHWDDSMVVLYGSSFCGLALAGGGLDLSVSMGDIDTDKKKELISELAQLLELKGFVCVKAILTAPVPVIKCCDPILKIPCHLTINNQMPLIVTKFLDANGSFDSRAKELIIFIKNWASKKKINSPDKGSLSSLGFTLLCISFLQRCNPPILPVFLEGKIPTFAMKVDGIEYGFSADVLSLEQKNTESFGELVYHFFDFYGFHHNFDNEIVSVRTLTPISKAEKNWEKIKADKNQGKKNDGAAPYRHHMAIESPFITSSDVGLSVTIRGYTDIMRELRGAVSNIKENCGSVVGLFA